MFVGREDVMSPLLLRDDPAPGGAVFGFGLSSVVPSINGRGEVAVHAFLDETGHEGDQAGIYRANGSSVVEIVRQKDPAPDGDGTYDIYRETDLRINASGSVAFTAELFNTSSPDTNGGIFVGSGGPITQIARLGHSAPDGNGTFSVLGKPDFNDAGVIAFFGEFADTVGGDADNAGIYLSDGSETLRVARKGDPLLGSTITGLGFRDGTGTNGPTRSGLNESTQVAYRAALADGREAIVLFTPDIHWRAPASGSWANKSNWTLGLRPAEMYHTLIDPVSGLNVEGPWTDTTVRSLSVGSTASGRAVLNLNGESNLTALETVSISERGEIRVGSGQVLTAPELHNLGILSGDGQVDAQLFNYSGAEIRVGGDERLRLTGPMPGSNAGEIEVNGGEIEFDAELVNAPSTGLIAGENATFRFKGGLDNQGSMALSFGIGRVHGEIDNAGYVAVSGRSEVTFFDDVSNAGVIQVSSGSTAVFFGDFSGNGCSGTGDVFLEGDTRPGFSPGEMSFGGDVTFGVLSSLQVELGGTVVVDEHDLLTVAGELTPGGTLQVVLIDEFAPDVGDTFDILDWDTLSGAEFASVVLPELTGRKAWDISGLYTSGEISVMGMLIGDTDVDWDVDADDYDTLLDTFGGPADWRTDFNEDGVIDIADFALQRANYGAGVSESGIAGDVPATPEPATLWLLSLGTAVLWVRRRR